MLKTDKICILGLSNDPSRYSHKALTLLQAKGYSNLVGVHPSLQEILGTRIFASLKDIPAYVHTVTVYLNPDKLALVLNDLISLKPKRVILNPGTERDDLIKKLEQGLPDTEIMQACTLVLLQTGQF